MSATVSATKVCSDCKAVKPRESFPNRSTAKDGLRSWCKSCEKERQSKWRSNNKDRRAEWHYNYHIKNRIRFVEYARKRRSDKREIIAQVERARSFGGVRDCSERYLKQLIYKETKISSGEITRSMVDAKRNILLLKRTRKFFGIIGTINQLQNITMENINKDIADLISLIAQGADCLEKAGKLLLEMERKNPEACNLILKQCPSMNISRLETLKRVGRGELNPYLLLDASPGAQRLLELPRAEQDKYMTELIPVATVSGGNVKVERKAIHELSKTESEIVFNSRRVRNPDEQVEMIRNRLASRQTRQSIRYAIDGEKITFYAHSTFTREQLEEILGRIPKPSAKQLESTIKKNQIAK